MCARYRELVGLLRCQPPQSINCVRGTGCCRVRQVLMVLPGGGIVAKLCDLGNSKTTSSFRLANGPTSAYYRAPDEGVVPQSDMYSFAVMLGEIVLEHLLVGAAMAPRWLWHSCCSFCCGAFITCLCAQLFEIVCVFAGCHVKSHGAFARSFANVVETGSRKLASADLRAVARR